MEFIEMLQTFVIPTTVVVCGTLGYIVSHYMSLDNKHIPAIMAVTGVIINILIGGYVGFTETIVTGMISGLASTGVHQLFAKYFKGEN